MIQQYPSATVPAELEAELAGLKTALDESEANQIEAVQLRGKVLDLTREMPLYLVGRARHPDLVDLTPYLRQRVRDLQHFETAPTKFQICERATEIARIAGSVFRKTSGLRAALLRPPAFLAGQLEHQLMGKGIEPVYQIEPTDCAPGWVSPWVRVWPGGR